MGKNQSASGLTNIIQYDTAGNISLVSGSTVLLRVSSSGAITTTGVISGSNALSSSYAVSASYAISASNAASASYWSGSITNAASASYWSGSITNALSASYAASASNASNTALFNSTASSVFATTGSNTFTGTAYHSNTNNAIGFSNTTSSIYTDGGLQVTKDAYISSSLYIKGNLTVYGTQSVSYITSSTLNISTNLITVNTSTPSVRFGGLAVQDSGSTAGLTGSLLWDSQNNSWLYDNPSGSGNYDSAMVIMGPRNSSTLGSEQGLNCNYLIQGHGHHHTTSSGIFHDGTNTCIGLNTFISGSGAAYFQQVGIATGTCTPNFRLAIFGCSNTTSDGSNLYLNTTSPLIQLKTSDNTVGNILGGIEVEGTDIINGQWYAGGIYFKSACNASTCVQSDIRFATRNGGDYNDRMTIRYNGNIGIGTITPISKFHVESAQTINYIKSSTSTNYVEYQADNATNALQMGIEGASGNRMGGTIAYNAYIGSYANYGLTFHTNNLNRVTIDNNGKVGIGCSTPTFPLSVVGVIQSRGSGVYVTQTVPTNTLVLNADDVCVHTIYTNSTVTLSLGTNNTSRICINSAGITTFACQVCIQASRLPQLTLLGLSTNTLSSDINDEVSIDFGRGALSKYSARISGYISNFSTYDGGLKFYSSNSGTLNALPQMTINSGGCISIGMAPSSSKLAICGNTNGSTPVLDIYACGDGTFLRGVRMLNSAFTTPGSSIMYALGYADSSYNMGQVYFQYAGAGSSNNSLRLGMHSQDHMLVLNGAGCISVRDNINFSIGCSGHGGATEWLRLDTNTGGSSTHYGFFIQNTRASAPSVGDVYIRMYANNGQNGSIYVNGTNSVAYGSGSDCRLKQNPKEICGICILNQLKPRNFEWISSGCRANGFYAQELYTVYPDAVFVGKDDEGTIWQTDNSKLIPVLTKALQEAICKINILENCLGIS
jgi:hypothetical protein